MGIKQQIQGFLAASPRYRIVVLKDKEPDFDVQVMDIGRGLASFIATESVTKSDLSIAITEEFRRLFYANITSIPDLGDCIELRNFGILFEPSLQFPIEDTLRSLSRNATILIRWEGEVDADTLYFTDARSHYLIHLKESNHIVL